MKRMLGLLAATSIVAASAHGQMLLNDSFSDGVLTAGSSLEGSWHYTTASSAIESGAGYMGLVTGTSGRGIHGVFTPGSISVGQMITASFTFMTPATIGTNKGESFRIGLLNSNGSNLDQDISSSSGSPNALLDPPVGYWMGVDVNTTTPVFNVRERLTPATSGVTNAGRLLSTNATGSGWNSLGSGSSASWTFDASTQYTGVLEVARTGADAVTITTKLLDSIGNLLSEYSIDGSSGVVTNYDTIAFLANSNTFGSSSTVGAADNGIDFSNVSVEITSIVPEPSTYAAFAGLLALGFVALRRRRKIA